MCRFGGGFECYIELPFRGSFYVLEGVFLVAGPYGVRHSPSLYGATHAARPPQPSMGY